MGESQVLSVTARSTNPALFADPEVAYTSPEGTGSLTLTLMPDAYGSGCV